MTELYLQFIRADETKAMISIPYALHRLYAITIKFMSWATSHFLVQD